MTSAEFALFVLEHATDNLLKQEAHRFLQTIDDTLLFDGQVVILQPGHVPRYILISEYIKTSTQNARAAYDLAVEAKGRINSDEQPETYDNLVDIRDLLAEITNRGD